MAAAFEQITADALSLSSGERERLAELLWESLPEEDGIPLSEAWLAEIRRRSKEIDEGAETFDADEVIADLGRELAESRREVA